MASSLCIVLLASVAIVGAIPRYGLESSYTMDVFNQRDEALSMQAGQTCPIYGAHEDCQTAQMGLNGSFHLCPGDGPCDPVKPCFYSSVCRCHSTLLTSPLLKCNSTTILHVEGTSVKVTHNILITPGTNVPDIPCFTVDPDIESCSKDCNCTISREGGVCINQTLTGDESNCTAEGCQCKRGFAPPDCCNCSRNFIGDNCENEVCDELCGRRAANGACLTCSDQFTPPTCCNCTEGYTRFDFECKCTNGTNADGSCKPGFEGEDCCQEKSCNIDQNLFFLLDSSSANTQFCPMAIVIHMLVAAFNPTSSPSGTKLSTVLFHNSDTVQPSIVFGLKDSCSDIQDSLKKLQQDYQHCGEDDYDHYYPSICGEFSRAVGGLKMIHDLIPANQPRRANALVIMTDGVLNDNPDERKAILDDLKKEGVSPILVFAVDSSDAIPVTQAKLINYTVSNNTDDVIIDTRDKIIDVGIAIVRRMEDTRVICKELAANITEALKDIQDQGNNFRFDRFCPAQRVDPNFNGYRVTKYPDCGGSLSLAYERKPKPKPNRQQMESANLEEEILAAVESVLENYKG